MRIVEVDERNSVATLRGDWQALQIRCPQATPYQTWEWNDAWWRHYGARKRPRLLLFYRDAQNSRTDDGDLVGIAPFYTSFHLGTPLRRLAWIGTGQSDYLGPLVLPEHETEVAAALREYLESYLRGWDMADLQQLRPDTTLYEQACGSCANRAADTHSLLPMEPCPYLVLPPDWNTLTARLGKKMRSNLGYYERLLHKSFTEVRFEVADAASLDAGMTALYELHQKRWNARWLPGVLGGKRVQAFHRDVAERFLQNGWLRLHLLHVDGAIRAALYCFALGGRTFYYLGGFAPELGKFSLGTLLTAKAIRQAIDEDCTEFDFLRGNEAYKYRWLPEVRVNHRLLLLRTGGRGSGLGELRGRAGIALNRVERYVEHRAKAFVEQQGRKERLGETGTGPMSERKPVLDGSTIS